MQDRTLLIIACATSIVGIVALYAITQLLPSSAGADIATTETGGKIDLRGTVVSVRQDAIGARVVVAVPVEAMAFRANLTDGIRPGAKVVISGSVSEYQGRKGVVAEEIRVDRPQR